MRMLWKVLQGTPGLISSQLIHIAKEVRRSTASLALACAAHLIASLPLDQLWLGSELCI